MLRWSGVVSTCEVWGLFKDLVPVESLTREEVSKQRQVMIPDFRVQLKSKDWAVRNQTHRTKIYLRSGSVQARCTTKRVQEGCG